jgi:prolyl-tRNA synthetase
MRFLFLQTNGGVREMKQSEFLLATLRELPADAEAISHQLLLKAGYIRQLAAGIYTFLPLGKRVLKKVEEIVREEMDNAGALEVLMPALQPADLWKQSGRYSAYGPELIRLQDRHQRDFVLGPTHEEVITTLMKSEINSYKKLPLNLYQIQTKYRDERRPRFGLLRGREFLMKDAYSFDTDWEGLDRSYQKMYKAYEKIFTRLGLTFRAVEADAGTIGGEGGTHEFMVLAESGEDTIVSCSSCNYAANLEKAVAKVETTNTQPASAGSVEKIYTPNTNTIEKLVEALHTPASTIIKTLLYIADGKPVAVLIRGDHEVNEVKVKNYLDVETLEMASADTVEQIANTQPGYVGPIGLSIPILIDHAITTMPPAYTGANEFNYHLKNVVPGRDFALNNVGDFRNVIEDDACPHCGSSIQLSRGIEVGHIFKLGTKYSESLEATFFDETGKAKTIIMGCYGIGISRLLSAIVEQHHDEKGIIWPKSIAPFHVHIILVSTKDENQKNVANKLYEQLKETKIDVLYDDRSEKPGVKFNDSDLIGIPIQVIVGRSVNEGFVEVRERGKEATKLAIENAAEAIRNLVRI